MKIIKSTFPYKAILFWLIVVGLFSLVLDRNHIISYSLTFLPVLFVSYILRYFNNTIKITEKTITGRINFDKYQIDLGKVKSFEVKRKNLVVQFVFGFPSKVTQVEYNKYDTLVLNSADPVLLEALSAHLT
jgi:hypothetical protein